MTRIAVKSAWARKRRLVGAFLAVFLGVSFLSGTLVLGETLKRNFDGLFADANAGTDAVVRSATKIDTDADFQRAPISATTVDASAASTASRRRSRTSRATASCSTSTVRGSAATVRPGSPPPGSATP